MEKILFIVDEIGVTAFHKLNVLIEEEFIKNGLCLRKHGPMLTILRSSTVSMEIKDKEESIVSENNIEIKKLIKSGVKMIYIINNSMIHENIPTQFPIINTLLETVLRVKQDNAKKIGFLISSQSIKNNLYEKYFKEACPKKEIVYPQKYWQKKVDLGINKIKNNKKKNVFSLFKEVCHHLVDDLDVELIILGSADISACFSNDSFKRVPLIKSLDILSKKICSYFSVEGSGNLIAQKFYDSLSSTIKNPKEIKNKSKDASSLDARFIKNYSGKEKKLLDIGSGTGLIINKICDSFGKVVAIERCMGLSKFIKKRKNLAIINKDVLELNINDQFDLVTLFGFMNYFNKKEAIKIYNKVFKLLKEQGNLIIKHQMGIKKTVQINGYSEELGQHYYSQYRTIKEETEILNTCGIHVSNTVDIYPKEYNRWDNTHYYALICHKITSSC